MKAKTICLILGLVAAGCGDGPNEPNAIADIEASITTAGVHTDADGYTLVMDGADTRAIATGAIVTFAGMRAGDHTLELRDVAQNCSVGGANPRTIKAVAGKITTSFTVSCSQVPLGLVFSSTRTTPSVFDVWSMSVDGTGPIIKITNGQAHLLSVSPDGARVAFTTQRDGNAEVYIVNADGSGLRNLTQRPGNDVYPAFSPDGSKIAVMSDRDGTSDILVMNIDGSNPVNITRSTGLENEPHWCANGRIVFTRSDAARQNDVYTMNADGSNVVRVTNDNVIVNTPRWSPDCSRIAFASIRHAGPNGHAADDLDIYVINADGSGLQRLTATAGFDVAPAWSPNGTRIAFTSIRDGNSEIYIMNADGTQPTNLTRSPAVSDNGPYWIR